jgi:hypothetical protein
MDLNQMFNIPTQADTEAFYNGLQRQLEEFLSKAEVETRLDMTVAFAAMVCSRAIVGLLRESLAHGPELDARKTVESVVDSFDGRMKAAFKHVVAAQNVRG